MIHESSFENNIIWTSYRKLWTRALTVSISFWVKLWLTTHLIVDERHTKLRWELDRRVKKGHCVVLMVLYRWFILSPFSYTGKI